MIGFNHTLTFLEVMSTKETQIEKRTWTLFASNLYANHTIYSSSAIAQSDTRSIFKRHLDGLNSEFSFSKTCCHTKVKELCLLYYLPIAVVSIFGFISLPRIWIIK